MNISIISKEVARWAEVFLFLAVATASSLSSVLADEAEVAYLQSTRRQPSNSYASSHRALMRDDEKPSNEEPDVASIINGTDTGGPISYQVGLARNIGPGPNCGGSLIAPRVVLTAAHCQIARDGTPIRPPFDQVLINQYQKGQYSVIVKASSYAVHPGWNATGYLENDIALWFLPAPIGEDDDFKFATLNDDPNVPADDEELFVSGWGYTVDGDPSSRSPTLLGTDVDYVTNEQCQSDISDYTDFNITIPDGMMCAAGDGTATCSGDSGGPLVIANGDGPAMDPTIQVGIVSWHAGKCGQFPAVYTRVSYYVEWIKSTACQKVGELCPSPSSKSGKAKSSDLDLKASHRQLSNSYASNNRALMRDEQPSKEEPDVASIIGGTPTDRPLPYQVGLVRRVETGGEFAISCGGSLIAPRVVLTEAHCQIAFETKLVLINQYHYNQYSVIVNASSSAVHPEYNPATKANDVALWFLPAPIGEDENFKFATLNEDPTVPADGEELFVSGWGYTKGDDGLFYPSKLLLGANVDYITNEQCQSDFAAKENSPNVTDGMMCAARYGTSPCRGDVGGPLVIANGNGTGPAMDPPIQVGIVYDYCNPNDPGIYNRVSHYVDWIRSTACQEVGELCPSSSKSSKSKSSKNDRP